jgi:hypothetical protein
MSARPDGSMGFRDQLEGGCSIVDLCNERAARRHQRSTSLMGVRASYEVVTLSPRVWVSVMRTYRSLPSCLAS